MSTWIGLDVECKDNRWKAVNQLTDEDDPPHITLAYLGHLDLVSEVERKILERTVLSWCYSVDFPEKYRVGNPRYESFANGNVTVLTVSELYDYGKSPLKTRDDLVDVLRQANFCVDTTYDFRPHVTVGHGDYVYTDVLGLEFAVGQLFISHNEERILEFG